MWTPAEPPVLGPHGFSARSFQKGAKRGNQPGSHKLMAERHTWVPRTRRCYQAQRRREVLAWPHHGGASKRVREGGSLVKASGFQVGL